jgi:hypothetical protein
MGAGCYLCELNYGTIPGKSAGDAVGACKLCGVLACLAHAIRNASRPAYTCGVCVPNLLAAAAVRNLGAGGTPPRPVSGGDDPSPDAPSSYARWALDVDDIEDVIGSLADDRWAWMRDDVEYLQKLLVDPYAPASLRAFAHPGADRARTLMAAAAAFATHLRLPPHELLPELQQVAVDVKRHA